MIGKIIFSMTAFILFIYIFLYKMIKKNDTTYIFILGCQAVGILINLIQILFNVLNGMIFTSICYILCIILPIVVIFLEIRGINFTEIMYLIVAKSYLMLGNRKMAKNILINLVTRYNESYYGHKMLADIYEKEGGMRKAIDEYVKVLDIRPNDHKSYFKISVLLNDLGRKDESIQMLQTLVKKRSELYEAIQMLGDLLIEKERFNEAIDLYMNSLKYHPDNFEIYYNLGIVYTRLNNFKLAKEYYEKAVQINNNFVNGYYRLGQISLLYRDIDEAEQNFINSLYGETEADSSFELAKIYILKDQPEKAAIFANKTVQLEPDSYEKIQKDPLFYNIKEQVVTLDKNRTIEKQISSGKEDMINEYLKDTYKRTKEIDLHEAQAKGINVNEFKWQKGIKKQRIDPN